MTLLRSILLGALLSSLGCAASSARPAAAPNGPEGACRQDPPPEPPRHGPKQDDVGTVLLVVAGATTLLAPAPLYYAAKTDTRVTAPELYFVTGAAIAAVGLFIAGGLVKATAHAEDDKPPPTNCGETDLTPLFKKPPRTRSEAPRRALPGPRTVAVHVL